MDGGWVSGEGMIWGMDGLHRSLEFYFLWWIFRLLVKMGRKKEERELRA